MGLWYPKVELGAAGRRFVGACAVAGACLVLTAAAAPLPSGVSGLGVIRISMGDQVVIAENDLWRPKLVGISPARPMAPTAAGSKLDAKDGQVAFALTHEGKSGTVLRVQSGLTKTFYYDAKVVLERNGQLYSAPTTVCTVHPGVMTLEQWPDTLVAVEVDSIVETADEDKRCR